MSLASSTKYTKDLVQFTMDRYPSLSNILGGETEVATLADQVYDQLLMRIIRGDVLGGTELKCARIAHELNVSRTPVNQALGRLQADGIVSQQANHRAVVRSGAENWLVDIHNLRLQVEPYAASSAAGRLPEVVMEELTLLGKDARSLPADQRRNAMRHFDFSLHLTVAEFCDNLAIQETISKCWKYKRLSYEAVADTDEALRRGYEEHLEILRLLGAGDAEKAALAMRNHLMDAATLRVHQRIV